MLLFFLTIIFPPWAYRINVWSTECFAGHRFILTPPELKSPDQFRQMFSVYDLPGGNQIKVAIAYVNLILEWSGLLFLTVGLYAVFSEDKLWANLLLGSLAIFIGLMSLILLFNFSSCHSV